ncbi:MAG TPA: sigma-70 family RNA polymerase sigma factor, partial [Isosphaeraceae bacterium]|nr:sigma-70 family RNA polymerase sigma factor [Isosphaeraceae bacterium]
MPGASSREVLRHLNTLFHCGAARPLTDQELLERFVAGDNEAAEAAFAALVDRHGAMVLGVCRRLLGNRHAAEDAFQSVFLVLARKAQAIARREQLASWLYGVARHDALDARARAARQKAREKRLGAMVPVEPRDETLTRELRTILDEELGRLPEKHRVAIVLCELEGLSRREAAIRLGVTEGTLSSRLARAKARLRDRLTRRGLAFSTAILASVLTQDAHALTVPPALFDSTIRLATLVAAGTSLAGVVSTSVVTLTDGVLKAMLLAKLKVVVLSLAAAALFTTGVGVLAQERGSDEDRLKNVERKLDKLLEVLGGSNRKAAAGAPETTTAAGGLVPIGQAPGSTPPTADGAVPASGMPSRLPPQIQQGQPARYPHELPAWEAAPGMFHGPTTGTGPTLAQRPQDTPQPKSLAARVGAVEQRLGDLEHQIGDLQRRLQQIDGGTGP